MKGYDTLSIFIKKKQKKVLKKINYGLIEKKASGGGNLRPNFNRFQDLLFFYEKAARSLLSGGTYTKVFINFETSNFCDIFVS